MEVKRRQEVCTREKPEPLKGGDVFRAANGQYYLFLSDKSRGPRARRSTRYANLETGETYLMDPPSFIKAIEDGHLVKVEGSFVLEEE